MFGFDDESGAMGDPWVAGCHSVHSSQFSSFQFLCEWKSPPTDRQIFGCRLGCEVRVISCREGDGNCTSKMKAGQFSIFGAVEENVGRGLCRGFGDRTPSSIYPANPLGALGFCRRENFRKKILQSRAGGLSTEDAQEMQKGGGQWAVVSFDSVLVCLAGQPRRLSLAEGKRTRLAGAVRIPAGLC